MEDFESQIGDIDVPEMLLAGVALHESFTSMCQAGFTEHQALYLIGVMMSTAQTQKGLSDSE